MERKYVVTQNTTTQPFSIYTTFQSKFYIEIIQRGFKIILLGITCKRTFRDTPPYNSFIICSYKNNNAKVTMLVVKIFVYLFDKYLHYSTQNEVYLIFLLIFNPCTDFPICETLSILHIWPLNEGLYLAPQSGLTSTSWPL